jgi:hypothetical protein
MLTINKGEHDNIFRIISQRLFMFFAEIVSEFGPDC